MLKEIGLMRSVRSTFCWSPLFSHSRFVVSLSSRDDALASPRRSVKDSTAKHPPTRPTQ